ncbi:hypothetical protein [Saccharopolyspora shandongensis]|uniref:hypothetical protein n=1 Tax=Saccharopolyspora shandongensis TaxID=418495 RepID=UPI00340646E0
MTSSAAIASLPAPGGATPPVRPGLWDILATAPWLIVVYFALRAGWTAEQLIALLVVLVPVMGIQVTRRLA